MANVDAEDGVVTRISNYPSSYSHVEFYNGNFPLNFSQEILEWSKDTVLENNDISNNDISISSLPSSSTAAPIQTISAQVMPAKVIGAAGIAVSDLLQPMQTSEEKQEKGAVH